MSTNETMKSPHDGGSELNELLGTDVIERSAKALFESEPHPHACGRWICDRLGWTAAYIET